MKSIKFKTLIIIFGTAFLLGGMGLEAAEESVSQQLDKMRLTLEDLKQQNIEIQKKQDQILEELDRLRVWVHRK